MPVGPLHLRPQAVPGRKVHRHPERLRRDARRRPLGDCQHFSLEAHRDALGQAFPIGEWESELFSYLGSEIYFGDDKVVLSQQAYAESRLFSLDIPRGVDDNDCAGPDLIADNRSLVGALSWLSAQSRPDLTCSVSMAQQVQKQPTFGDLKFTNLVSKKAYDHREEGLRFKPIPLADLIVIVYHDAGWANARDTDHDEPGFELTPEDKLAGLQQEGPFVARDARKARRQNSKVASPLRRRGASWEKELQCSRLEVQGWTKGVPEHVLSRDTSLRRRT